MIQPPTALHRRVVLQVQCSSTASRASCRRSNLQVTFSSIALLCVFGLKLSPLYANNDLDANSNLATADLLIDASKQNSNASLDTQSELDAQMLYRLSGMQKVVAYIPTSAADSFENTLTTDQLHEQFQAIDPQSISSIIRSSFTTETFDRYLVREINRILSPESKTQMIDWFHSALGQRFVQAEIDHSLLSAGERFESFKKHIRNSEVDEPREMMMLELDKTMQASESAVDMMSNVQMAFNMSLSPFLPEQYRLSRADLELHANQSHSRLMMEYRSQTREVLLFTYQNFSIKELRKLNATLATSAGQEFVAAINSGVKKAMFSASLDMGDGLGALLGQVHYGAGI